MKESLFNGFFLSGQVLHKLFIESTSQPCTTRTQVFNVDMNYKKVDGGEFTPPSVTESGWFEVSTPLEVEPGGLMFSIKLTLLFECLCLGDERIHFPSIKQFYAIPV